MTSPCGSTLETEVRSTLVAELADPLLAPLHADERESADETTPISTSPRQLVTNGAFRLARSELRRLPRGGSRASLPRPGRRSGWPARNSSGWTISAWRAARGHGRRGHVLGPRCRRAARRPTADRSVWTRNFSEMTLDRFNARPRTPARPAARMSGCAGRCRWRWTGPREVRRRCTTRSTWCRRGCLGAGHARPPRPEHPAAEDASEARRLLAAAGYPGGRGFPVLIMPLPPRWRAYPYLRDWAERWYRELGIRTYITYESDAERDARAASGGLRCCLQRHSSRPCRTPATCWGLYMPGRFSPANGRIPRSTGSCARRIARRERSDWPCWSRSSAGS